MKLRLKFVKEDFWPNPIQSNPIQPNPWMNPIHVQLWVEVTWLDMSSIIQGQRRQVQGQEHHQIEVQGRERN